MHPALRSLASDVDRSIAMVNEAKANKKAAKKNFKLAALALINQQLKTAYFNLTFGYWDCDDSPTGKCVYDDKKDPCLDICLFCGHPDERK